MNPVCAYVNVVCAFLFIETLLAPYGSAFNLYIKHAIILIFILLNFLNHKNSWFRRGVYLFYPLE